MERRAARVIRLQQHVRKSSSKAVRKLCPASRTDLQPSAGPHRHPKTITCHCKTCSALPSNTYMLFLKDRLQKPAPPVVTIPPLFPSPNR